MIKKEENKTTEKQGVKLVMWGGEEDQDMFREMADKFIELHKDEVNLTIEIGVESEQSVKDTVLGDVEGAADVFSFASDQINELVAAGALMAIPDEMNRKDVEERNSAGSVEASTGVTSWQQWDNPTIKDIVIPAGAEVIVGIRADAAAKAWGAWDDFTLYQVN